MKIILRILIPIIILGGGASAIKWLMANRPVQEKRPKFSSPPVVEAVPLRKQDVTITIETQGTVHPRIRTELVSQVGGRIIEISENLRDGSTFKQGDVLVKIEAADYEIAVATAEANLVKARLNVEELKLQSKRVDSDLAIASAEVAKAKVTVDEETARSLQAARDWQRLNPKDEAPALVLRKPQLASANAAVEAAKARLEQSKLDQQLAIARIKTAEATVSINQTTLERAKLDLSRTSVTAPYDGRILSQKVDAGRFVSPGTTLASIYPTDEVEIRLPCSSAQLKWLEVPGASVMLKHTHAPSAPAIPATIVRTEGAFDNATRQLSLIARIENPPANLQIGQFLTANITGTTLNDHYELPRSTVRSGNQILLVDAKSRISRHVITPIFSDANRLVTAGPLPENVRLCTTPIAFATPNLTVHVKGDAKPARGDGPKKRAGKKDSARPPLAKGDGPKQPSTRTP